MTNDMKTKTYWVDINSIPIEATSREEAEKIFQKKIKDHQTLLTIVQDYEIN